MGDRLAHRGPDDARVWRVESAALAFRRLAIIDPTEAGAQPMCSSDGRLILVYNGELYNDAELRAELTRADASDPPARPARFRSRCDAETVLHAWARWGAGALERLRGMFALAVLDLDARALTLARDPLGIKPLFLWRGRFRGQTQLAFASEPASLLLHPAVTREPDPAALSAYLTTIRATLGRRTVYRDIECLQPGEVRRFDLASDRLIDTSRTLTVGPAGVVPAEGAARGRGHGSTAAIVEDSVRRHLRADRPIAAMLSGGLDSSIIARLATDAGLSLRTYAAGSGRADDDITAARAMAEAVGSTHREVMLDSRVFAAGWTDLVRAHALPLSTPNEVAIAAIARAMRADGCAVALSGEGADELFGGYEAPLRAAAEHVARGNHDPALFHLDAHAWIARAAKPSVLNPAAFRAADNDEPLAEAYRAAWRSVGDPGCDRVPSGHALAHSGWDRPPTCPAAQLAAHLRMHRAINLPGLLLRLDMATMRAGVEGRTPLADALVAAHAESLPMGERFRLAPAGRAETKIALRAVFADRLPSFVGSRDKASFPLPFQSWMSDAARALPTRSALDDWFTPAALSLVRASPAACWPIAWPILNIALWFGAIEPDLARSDSRAALAV